MPERTQWLVRDGPREEDPEAGPPGRDPGRNHCELGGELPLVGVGRIGDPDQHRDDTGARGEPGQLERIGPLRAARDDDPAGSCRGCLKAVARPLGGGDHGERRRGHAPGDEPGHARRGFRPAHRSATDHLGAGGVRGFEALGKHPHERIRAAARRESRGGKEAPASVNLPDERAGERTYQLLTQAVGRAGRGERPGLAIIQTYQPDHPAILAVASGDASAFYDAELNVRSRFGSPPFGRLIKLTVALPDPLAAEHEAGTMAERLRAECVGPVAHAAGIKVTVLGPAPAYIARRAGRWRWNVVLRGDRPLEILGSPPGAPWSIDVDPDTLL